MNRLRWAWLLFLVSASCDVGSLRWVLPEENGISHPARLTVLPGSTGQATLQLVAEGSYAGKYEVAANSVYPEVSTASLNATTADLRDGVPLDVAVTVTVADTANAGEDGSVELQAKSTVGEHSALTTVIVKVGS